MANDNSRAEALKTFVEQTKLLVTLASGFLIAPAAALQLLKSAFSSTAGVTVRRLFFSAEFLLIASILCGFFVLGSIAGSQHQGQPDVYRPATRRFSVLQLALYLGGLICFVMLLGRST